MTYWMITYVEIWPDGRGHLEQRLPRTTSTKRHPADWLINQRRAIYNGERRGESLCCRGIHLLMALEISEEQHDAVQSLDM